MRLVVRILAPIAVVGAIAVAALSDLRVRYDDAKQQADSSLVNTSTLLQAAATAKIAHARLRALSTAADGADDRALRRENRMVEANLGLIESLSSGAAAAEVAEIRRLLARSTDQRQLDAAFSVLVAAAATEGEREQRELYEELKRLLDDSFYSVLAATITAIALYAWLGASITVPLRRLLRFTEAITEGKTPPELRATRSRSELGRLTNTFQRMARALSVERSRLERLAYFDQETHLPNRAGFTEEVEQRLRDRKPTERAQLVVMRFPRLSMMEALFGKGYGRLAERAVKDRLLEAVREEELGAIEKRGPDSAVAVVAGRLRFDVFAVFVSHGEFGVADRLLGAYRRPAQVAERMIRFEPSGAVAVAPDDGADAGEIIDAAEIALDTAQQAGPSVYFAPELREKAIRDRELESRLRAALEADAIEAFFQPKIACPTGAIVGFEALARWRDADGGWISPGVFVPIAERTGAISQLDYAVMRRAVAFAARMRGEGFDICAAANISSATLEDPRLVDTVQAALRAVDVEPTHLELEITESAAVADLERALRPLEALRSSGVRVAIDDFGTGYSSLASLQALPIDTLKLDRSFLPKDETDADAIAITEAVLTLANKLRLSTVAEGVETEWQAAFVRSRGCNIAQGFLFGRPLPAADFEAMLREEAAGRVADRRDARA